MLMRRVIPCMDVRGGRVVKGVRFQGLRDAGDPIELAAQYESQGADELTLLDVSATPEAASTMLDVIRSTQHRVGLKPSGGIRDLEAAHTYLELARDAMGPDWISPATFRFGASGLRDALIAVIEGRDDTGASTSY